MPPDRGLVPCLMPATHRALTGKTRKLMKPPKGGALWRSTPLPELSQMMLIPRPPRSPILMTWRNRSACLDEDPELFFPIGNTGPALLRTRQAKAVCRRCEVVETCLRWAIESGQDAGVWGALSEDERRSLKRRNARARRAG